MVTALIGLAGVVGGLILGGIGKYFTQRRDAWLQARAAGLMLLADIRTLRGASDDDAVIAATELGVKSWEQQRKVLAGFRRGSYPNGLKASEWLALADHFARLRKIYTMRKTDWWDEAKCELEEVEHLLAPFMHDPAVLPYVFKTGWRKARKRLGTA